MRTSSGKKHLDFKILSKINHWIFNKIFGMYFIKDNFFIEISIPYFEEFFFHVISPTFKVNNVCARSTVLFTQK